MLRCNFGQVAESLFRLARSLEDRSNSLVEDYVEELKAEGKRRGSFVRARIIKRTPEEARLEISSSLSDPKIRRKLLQEAAQNVLQGLFKS